MNRATRGCTKNLSLSELRTVRHPGVKYSTHDTTPMGALSNSEKRRIKTAPADKNGPWKGQEPRAGGKP